MRIEDVEQSLGDLREIIVDAQMHARRQQRERFDHPLDVGIFATVGFQQQPGGDLGMLVGELRSHLAQEGEFAFVIISQLIAHCLLP